MPDSLYIEFKKTWPDDYLKWGCGFANAIGGQLFIGLAYNLKMYREKELEGGQDESLTTML